jgi:4-amino-4-deoxy-L-arabinose transferase-like glycosyltransferase
VVTGEDGVALWSRAASDDTRTAWAWIAGLTAAAVGLRAIGLDGGLWFDEIATLTDSVRLPLSKIVTEFPANNQHTLYSVLAHLSIGVFGDHPWSLRLPALILGAATVPALYLFAREFVGRGEALLACVLLTTAYHHVWFSQNARGYSGLALCTVTGSWLLLRTLRRGRAIDAVGYGVATALGVYAHLTMVFLIVSHAILCLAAGLMPGQTATRRRRWRVIALAFVLAGTCTLLLYAPVLLDVKQFFVDRPSEQAVATPKWAVVELLRGLQIGLGAAVGAVASGVLLFAGVWSYVRQSPFVAGVFVLPGVVTVAAALAIGRPMFPRFLFFLIAFGLLIIVRGALEIGRYVFPARATAVGTSLIVAIAATSLVALIPNYRYPKQDFEGAMRFVDEQRPAVEPVVTVGLITSDVYRDYYDRDWPVMRSLGELQSVRAQGQRVWVLYALERYIQSDTPDLMQTLRSDCVVTAVFRGTVGNGDITVCVAPPIAPR